jgi:hypothetical protein
MKMDQVCNVLGKNVTILSKISDILYNIQYNDFTIIGYESK